MFLRLSWFLFISIYLNAYAYILKNNESYISSIQCTQEKAIQIIDKVEITPTRTLEDMYDLMCATEFNEYRDVAALYLCSSFIALGDLYYAYKYAIRSLEISPHFTDASMCLASVYYETGSFLRSAFYAELAYNYNPHYMIPLEGVDSHLYEHLYSINDVMFPAVEISPDTRKHLSPVRKIIASHLNGNMTLHSLYYTLQTHLPDSHRGSTILSQERFLDDVEYILSLSYQHFPSNFLNPSLLPLPATGEFCTRWPQTKYLYLYNFDQVYNTYGETLIGISDALTTLRVPHSIVSHLGLTDEDIVVKPVGGPLGVPVKARYVIWNFEKNPTVSKEGGEIGFIFDSCGREEACYDRSYVVDAFAYWESIHSNMRRWRDPSSASSRSTMKTDLNLVPGFVPNNIILSSRALLRFQDIVASQSRLADIGQPIDILFYGSSNDHRLEIWNAFAELANEHNLRVEFHMGYQLFGSKRDSIIDQAKIVLNIANFPWPPSAEDISTHPSYCTDPHSIETFTTPVNWHRIKGLMARGKVVLSERSGCVSDEEHLSGLVIFADTAALPQTALALLRDPALRRDIEKHAVEYMIRDQLTDTVMMGNGDAISSSLKFLTDALNNLAVHAWSSSLSNTCGSPLSSEYPRDCVSHLDFAQSSPERALMWAECACSHTKYTSIFRARPLSPTAMSRTVNSSSFCDTHINGQILLGYLWRRYNYAGSILQIGCSTYQFDFIDEKFPRYCIHTNRSGNVNWDIRNEDYLIDQLNEINSNSFDIIILHDMLSFDEAWSSLQTVLPYLSHKGAALVRNTRPMYIHESFNYEGSRSIYWTGDIWKILLYAKTLPDFELSMADFDGGIAVIQRRRNSAVTSEEVIKQSRFSFSYFAANIDQFVHTLSIHQLHKWLAIYVD